MPYAERLEPFAEWFAQLWAESLGKDGGGQTPARALGATDQHSQLQLYRAGRRNTMVSFVTPRERPAVEVPEPDAKALAYLAGTDLGELLDAELQATEASLAEAGRPNVRVEIDRLDAHSLGELLYGMCAACIMAGELAGVDTFTQPAVEWGRRPPATCCRARRPSGRPPSRTRQNSSSRDSVGCTVVAVCDLPGDVDSRYLSMTDPVNYPTLLRSGSKDPLAR